MGVLHELQCHPDTPARLVSRVSAEWTATDHNDVLLTFRVDGAEALRMPGHQSPARTDGLWQTTCFEMFWKPDGGDAYFEFNLSPSSYWAAYAFVGHRAGMRDLAVPVDPFIEATADGLEADLDLSALPPGPAHVALSAVIEEVDGTKSYWALRHPPGAPDFHHPDCFAWQVPALA